VSACLSRRRCGVPVPPTGCAALDVIETAFGLAWLIVPFDGPDPVQPSVVFGQTGQPDQAGLDLDLNLDLDLDVDLDLDRDLGIV
jgi:hypothetical protein